MQIKYNTRHADVKPMAKEYALTKLQDIVDRKLQLSSGVDLYLEKDANLYIAKCNIYGGLYLTAKSVSAYSFYEAIDGMMDKVYRQLKRRKEKRLAKARKPRMEMIYSLN